MNNNSSMSGLASLVQSRGRNGDSVLVHMTPGEVQGLQSLALAHGGSLTLNPDTGLYEANFLKKLLPTLLGFGLNFLFPGLGALGSGLLVGAGETIRTGGDLGKGLMAGLGAFGGAGLGSSLAGIGAASSDAATKMLTQEAVAGAGKDVAAKVAQETAANQVKQQMANQAAANLGSTGARFANLGTGFKNAATGLKEVVTGGQGLGLSGFGGAQTLANVMPGGIMGLSGAGMGIANAMTPEFKPPMSPEEEERMYYESYGYDPAQGRFLGGQFRRGYPGYPPTGMAAGGPVMPAPNYNYPQAGITKTGYSAPMEYIKPREVLDGYDTKIDPFTGEERFADGGPVNALIPPPVSPLTPLPEEPIYSGGVGPAGFVNSAGTGVSQPVDNRVQMGPQSLEQYYQSLLSAPQAQAPNQDFANYMQGLNQFVTSPIAPPPAPPPPPPPPPGGGTNTGGGTTTNPGGTGGGVTTGGNNTRWDPNLGRFVSDAGSPGDAQVDLDAIRDAVSGMFPGFNFDMSGLQNYLGTGGYGDTSGLNWDPVSGSFMRPGSQTAFTPPGSGDSSLDMNNFQFNPSQFQFDPGQFQFDPNQFQLGMNQPSLNPFVEGFDMSSLPGYEQQMFAEGGSVQRAAAGKLITGDGDGMSDDIRANINGDQEARLADGEFVIPADVVSHLGNGSTEAGADVLHEMMNRIREARTGRTKQAPEVDPGEYLPA